MAAEIKAKGVEFTKEPTTIRPGVRICFIRGPQGISIELLGARQEICIGKTARRLSGAPFDAASSRFLGHAARHEAADGRAHIAAQRPHHGSADAGSAR